jgi:glycine/D-amino acid oxidase-like deaminating enzyme
MLQLVPGVARAVSEEAIMELWQIALVVIVLAAAGIGLAMLFRQRTRTQELSGRFGPEYRHTLDEAGDKRAAEQELQAREARVRQMEIRPLTTEERDRFAPAWRSVQARFVDDPSGSITEADLLVTELLAARGYEVGEDFERKSADVSVDHGQVVGEYRLAHAIAERHATDGVDTEELRQAMIHYRALFDELLEVDE